jgi:acetyl-CoA carboxylase biotin carboxyl carrier protein
MAKPTDGGHKRGQPTAPSLKEVVELAARHDLTEIEVESAGVRIRVVRGLTPAREAPSPEARSSLQVSSVDETTARTGVVTIEAPMVGTFYRASAPAAAPFVNEGDAVKEGPVLCIIEAMKLMNEIEAKINGRIAKILVENGQPVEYGQPLFLVEPAR